MKWKNLNDDELEKHVVELAKKSPSMRHAAASSGMNFQTFRKYAKKFNVWVSNQPGKKLKRKSPSFATSLQEILEGKHPNYGYGRLKDRLLKTGIKKNQCENCGITEWCGKPLVIQLDHKNGNRYDHRLENLRMLCPNCHSQTMTYCGRNVSVA